MSSILDRAKSMQRDSAGSTSISVRLSFLQDLIAEIERLQSLVPPLTVKDILERQEGA